MGKYGASYSSRHSNGMSVGPLSDYLVVGGGSAGCALASRLSEDPKARVTLVEAGDDYADDEPAVISDSRMRATFATQLFWPGITASMVDANGERDLPVFQARVMGGGSAINGLMAWRGLPADYDEWQSLGATGWDWESVLPYFRKLENDLDCNGALHGRDGPIIIKRLDGKMAGFSQVLADGMAERQVGSIADINSTTGDGFGRIPLNSDGRRVSSARGYLNIHVRSRPNLRIVSKTTISRLLIQDGTVIGAEAVGPEGPVRLMASKVILSAGAVQSPTLLFRSGIGPGQDMQALGIEVLADRRGVGRNLQNHPNIVLAAHLPRKSRTHNNRHPSQNVIRYSSNDARCAPSDMFVHIFDWSPGPTAWHPAGLQMGCLFGGVGKSYSRGALEFDKKDPNREPSINYNMLDDERDADRMIGYLETMATILQKGRSEGRLNEIFIASKLGGLSGDNILSATMSTLGALVMSGPTALRRRVISQFGPDLSVLPSDRGSLRELVQEVVTPAAHSCGTCKMGNKQDDSAVVDPSCKVIGFENLYVADTSIFPSLPTSGTNLPAIMAGEKLAAMLLAD